MDHHSTPARVSQDRGRGLWRGGTTPVAGARPLTFDDRARWLQAGGAAASIAAAVDDASIAFARRVRVMWNVWLPTVGWHMRLDLTYRAGTDECVSDDVSPARAERTLRRFLNRLARTVQDGLTYVAARERQKRGTLHWHVLLRFHGGSCPWISHGDLTALWQRWRKWPKEVRAEGVEGFLWVRYLSGSPDTSKEVRYVVKYVVKAGADGVLVGDLDGPLQGRFAWTHQRFKSW